MNIDVHWHYAPQAYRERMAGQDARLPPMPELYDPALLQYRLDAAEGLRLHQMVNDSIADLVAAYPDRYVGLATVPLQDPTLAMQELERAMQVKGLRGVEICTNVAGRNLDDPALLP